MRASIAAAFLISSLPLSGCTVAALGAVGAVGLASAKDKSLGESLDDAATTAYIKGRLLAVSAERFGEVDIKVADGLVLLSGRVNAPEDRVEAEGIAWEPSGTLDVANEVRIEPPGGFVANVADEVISARVRARLIGSATVKSINFNVETYNGVVYLMGIARSAEELRRAAEEASVVGGVQQVVSYVRLQDQISRPQAPIEQVSPPYQPAPDAAYDMQPLPDLQGVKFETGRR